MPIIADRVAETTATTGTGTLQLLGAKHGYQTFVSGVGSGATTYFVVLDLSTGDWELCSGVVTAGSPTTLTRGTVLDGSNGPGVSVAFAAGLKDVFVSAPAARLPVLDPITGALSIPGDLAITGSVYSSASTADAGRSTNKFRDLWLSRDAHIGGALTAGASTLASLILTAALTLANGGTGLSAWTGGDLPYYASGTALSKLAIGGANTVLVSSGAAPQWASSLTGLTAVSATNLTGTLQTPAQPNITSVGTLSSLVITAPLAVTSGGNGLSTATVGDLRYGSGANTLAALAGNVTSTKKFLTQTGTGSISAAPGWGQVLAGDVQAGIFSGSFTFSSLLAASVSGNAATATALATSRTLWGQAFDGSANVSGALSGATTGGFSGIVTASGFTVSAAVGKLIPGATSFSLRNSADTADNLLITDAGAVTVRALLTANAGLTVGSGLTTLSYAINAQNDVLILGNTHVGTSASSRVLFANNTSSGAAQIIHYGGNHATLPNQLWIVNANPASLVLGTNNVAALTLASGGAATFAGTVVANGMITAHNPAGDTAQLSLLAQPNSSLSRDWRFASNNGTFGDLQLLRSTTAGGTTTTLAATFDATAFTLASHQFFGTDNAYDIGASGANRARNLYLAGTATTTQVNITAGANAMNFTGAGTSYQYLRMVSTGAANFFGIESSTGANLLSGTTAYAASLGTTGATDLFLGTNSVQRLKLDGSTGAATFAGNATFTGGVVAASGTVRTTGSNALVVDSSNGAGYAATVYQASTTNKFFVGTDMANQLLTGSSNGDGCIISVNTNIRFSINNGSSTNWLIGGTTGHFLAGTDNAYDIGASGANRPRNVYVAGNVTSGGVIYAATNFNASAVSTGSAYTTYSTAGGSTYFGADNSTGTSFNSGLAYAAVVYTPGGLAVSFDATTRNANFVGKVGIGITPSIPLQVQYAMASNVVTQIVNSSATNPYGIYLALSSATPNDGVRYFLQCQDSTQTRFTLWSNGGIANYSANNTNLSDERTKHMGALIDGRYAADAFAKLAPVWQRFQFKDQTHGDDNIGTGAHALYGLLPLDIRDSIVNTTDGWGEKDELKLWTIYETDLNYLSHAAVSNLAQRMETTEDDITLLKAKLAELEIRLAA